MTTLNTPAIGDEVLDPNEKFDEVDGVTKYDQLLADGSIVDKSKYPVYWDEASYPAIGGGNRADRQMVMFCGTVDTENRDFGGTEYLVDIHRASVTRDLGIGGYDYSATTGYYEFSVSIPYTLATPKHYLSGGTTWHSPFHGDILIQYLDSSGIEIIAVRWLDLGDISYTEHMFSYRVSGGAWVSKTVVDYNSHGLVEIDGTTFTFTAGTAEAGTSFSIQMPSADIAEIRAEGYVDREGGYPSDATYCGIGVELLPDVARRPNMDSGSDACPYRVVADKYTPSIGEVRPSNLEKYSEDGVAMFDNLLCDGSEVLESEHPEYWAEAEQYLSRDSYLDDSNTSELQGLAVYMDEIYAVNNLSYSYTTVKVFDLDLNYLRDVSLSVVAEDPYGVAFDSAGLMWVPSNNELVIRSYSSTGTWQGVQFSVSGQCVSIRDIAIYDDILYVADGNGRNIQSYSLSGEYLGLVYATGDVFAMGLYVDSEGLHMLDILTSTVHVVGLPTLEALYTMEISVDVGAGMTGYHKYGGVSYMTEYTNSTLNRLLEARRRPTNTSTYPGFPDHVIADLTEDV